MRVAKALATTCIDVLIDLPGPSLLARTNLFINVFIYLFDYWFIILYLKRTALLAVNTCLPCVSLLFVFKVIILDCQDPLINLINFWHVRYRP